jgi:hypothetical protein
VKRVIVSIVLSPSLSFERVFTLDRGGLDMVQNHGCGRIKMVLPEASTACLLGKVRLGRWNWFSVNARRYVPNGG